MGHQIFAGVDVGGTNIKVGLVNETGEVLVANKFPTAADQHPEISLKRAHEMIVELTGLIDCQYEDVLAVGLATPGPMDIPAGIVTTPFNLPGWRHHNVRDLLANFTDRTVSFANDAGAAAFGEYWSGKGSDYSSVILLTLGTGVGGGIIVNDFSIEGANSHGAEIGHMVVDQSDDARLCSCGKRGHLEAYASATAVVARVSQLLDEGQKSIVSDYVEKGEPISSLLVFRAAEKNDELSFQVINEAADALAVAIASLVHIIDPEAILIGGAMTFGGYQSEVGENFLSRIKSVAQKFCLPRLSEVLNVEFASLGSDAGFIGAAGLAKRDYDRKRPAVTA